MSISPLLAAPAQSRLIVATSVKKSYHNSGKLSREKVSWISRKGPGHLMEETYMRNVKLITWMGVACLKFHGENFRGWLVKFVKDFSLESFLLYTCTCIYSMCTCSSVMPKLLGGDRAKLIVRPLQINSLFLVPPVNPKTDADGRLEMVVNHKHDGEWSSKS